MNFLFHSFLDSFLSLDTYRGFCLLACDGSDLDIVHNPNDRVTHRRRQQFFFFIVSVKLQDAAADSPAGDGASKTLAGRVFLIGDSGRTIFDMNDAASCVSVFLK